MCTAVARLHRLKVRGHRSALRPRFSAQIRSTRIGNPQVRETSPPELYDRESG
jgi:hypothetical protein